MTTETIVWPSVVLSIESLGCVSFQFIILRDILAVALGNCFGICFQVLSQKNLYFQCKQWRISCRTEDVGQRWLLIC